MSDSLIAKSTVPLQNIEDESDFNSCSLTDLSLLFEKNRQWAQQKMESDPDFFRRISEEQKPKYLWIGCSDSRVPANQILGLEPGEVFVHRNIANLVLNNDMNCLSVIQYAVEVLKVEHIIVCGHYRCGGIKAACGDNQLGLIDNWLRNIKDTFNKHGQELYKINDPSVLTDRLSELNVLEQVQNVCHTTFVQNAWAKGQPLAVHGLIYSIDNGLLNNLATRISAPKQIKDIYKMKMK